MVVVPSEAEALIARHQLGKPKKIYKPRTIASIITGSFLIAFACAWITGVLFFTVNSFTIQANPLLPSQIYNTPMSLSSPFNWMIIPGIVFTLIGLVFVVAGILTIINAFLYRRVRAVLCEHGVAHLGIKKADAFRWEEVATVLDKVNVHTGTTDEENGSSSTTRTISHTYTVACMDGRRFVFDKALGEVEQLGEEIQIAVAIHQKATKA